MITYETNKAVSKDAFIDILKRSTLAERRPVDDKERIAAMLINADLIVTAWHKDLLVGIARSVTDYAYCCYLSDLAVDVAYQQKGIGKKLIELTHQKAGSQCLLVLLAAPASVEYYSKVGLNNANNCFIRPRKS
jgi:GNAT superfamily N-acetyltransferase